MATTLEWQHIKCRLGKALSETTPARVVTAVGNVWKDYSLGLRDRPQFVAHLSGAILDCYQKKQGSGDVLPQIAEECFRMVVEDSEDRELADNEPLPESLEFARKRLQARLDPNDPDEVFRWLRLCYDLTDKDASHFFSLFGFDRDEEMRQLVFDEDETKVRPYFMEDQSSRLHLRKIADWFLRRYDLTRALQLFWHLRALQLFWHLNSFFSSRARVARITIRLFPTFAQEKWLQFQPKVAQITIRLFPTFFVLLFIIGGFLWKFWLPPEKVLWYGLLVVVIGSPLAVVLFKNVLLPRLLAGIAIGYLFLLPGKDFWEFAVSQKADATLQIWLLAGLTLFASWLYLLYGEVKRVVIKSGEAKKRALLIFIIGLSQSIAVGFILSGLLAPPLARWQNWEGLVKAGEWFGIPIPFGIFPMAFVFQVPVAFFVGILSQILWEDKPVTEPL
jgi:hypothetical protein